MRGWVFVGTWVAFGLEALVAPSGAAACSPPIDAGVCLEGDTPRVFPTADAVDVPLNVEVDLAWHRRGFIGTPGTTTPSTTFRLRAADGEVVSLVPSTTTRRWRPATELRPDTRYAIEDHDRRVPVGPGCEPAPEHVEIAAFTTGTARDDTAPATPVDGRFAACCRYEHCDSGSCCGPYRAAIRGVEFTAEAGATLEYRVDGRGSSFGGASTSAGFVEVGYFGHPGLRPELSAGDVEARAIDAAGNASPWSAVLTVPGCEPRTRPDAGDWIWTDSCVDGPGVADAGSDASGMDGGSPATDAGVAMDGGAERTHAMACRATAGRTPPAAWLGLAALALALRRISRG